MSRFIVVSMARGLETFSGYRRAARSSSHHDERPSALIAARALDGKQSGKLKPRSYERGSTSLLDQPAGAGALTMTGCSGSRSCQRSTRPSPLHDERSRPRGSRPSPAGSSAWQASLLVSCSFCSWSYSVLYRSLHDVDAGRPAPLTLTPVRLSPMNVHGPGERDQGDDNRPRHDPHGAESSMLHR